jgi:MarR family transcriptional regulator, organic hydroperoxide resistance regulator
MPESKTSVSRQDLRAWTSVVRAYQLCSDALVTRLKLIGLKLPQFEVLVRLLYEPGQTQQDLAQHSFVVKSHMSGLLAEMAEEGLIKRVDSALDKRSKVVTLTAKGTALAKKAAAVQAEVVSTMLTPLSAKQIHDVEAAMMIVSAALEDLQSSSPALSANAKALRRQKK